MHKFAKNVSVNVPEKKNEDVGNVSANVVRKKIGELVSKNVVVAPKKRVSKKCVTN